MASQARCPSPTTRPSRVHGEKRRSACMGRDRLRRTLFNRVKRADNADLPALTTRRARDFHAVFPTYGPAWYRLGQARNCLFRRVRGRSVSESRTRPPCPGALRRSGRVSRGSDPSCPRVPRRKDRHARCKGLPAGGRKVGTPRSRLSVAFSEGLSSGWIFPLGPRPVRKTQLESRTTLSSSHS